MKLYSCFIFIWLMGHVNSWKPILNPSAFSVYQTFPGLASESVPIRSNNAIHKESVDSALGSFINKNEYTDDGSCAVEKFAIDHEAKLKYSPGFSKLEQFTLCMWVRFTKHDGDHVLFTYSVHDEPREVQFWVANSNNSSFVSLAVRGHSLYRLNYPLSLKKWHHTCTSWNGKTGEWQLWIKSERVGRGFYNRLVSHEIEAGGNAFTGGKSPNGPTANGLHFEVTLVQLYSVALSAGKAHRNHKHHHVHKFDHNGEIEATTAAPTTPAIVNQPINPLLANGQFPTRVGLNLVPQPQVPLNTNFVRGQFHTGNRNLQQQLLNGNIAQQTARPQVFASSPNVDQFKQLPFLSALPSSFGSNSANIQVIDEASLHDLRFKRQSNRGRKTLGKRALVTLTDGSIVDDKFFDNEWYDGLAQFGNKGLKNSLTNRDNLEEEIKEHDREPAEGEVDAVRGYCNFCLNEPFHNALVLDSRNTLAGPNVLKAKASTVCGDF